MKRTYLILIVLLVILFCPKPKETSGLKDLDGNLHKISNYKGKLVLVDFWATWCPPCIIAIPHIVKIYEKYQSKGLVVIGISTDSDIDKLTSFVNKEKIPYLILIANDEIVRQFNINAIPTLFLFNKKGEVVYKQVGFSSAEMSKLDKKIAELIEK